MEERQQGESKYPRSSMQAKYLKQWTREGTYILKRWSKKGPRVHLVSSRIQIRHLKLFPGDSECQIKAKDEVYFWSRFFFFFPLKILPEVIVLMNFMVPKHYLAYSQDPSWHWKSGGHIWKWDFQRQAMPWRFSLQNKYQMLYLITMNSQNKHAANSWVQRLYPTITAAIFFSSRIQVFFQYWLHLLKEKQKCYR